MFDTCCLWMGEGILVQRLRWARTGFSLQREWRKHNIHVLLFKSRNKIVIKNDLESQFKREFKNICNRNPFGWQSFPHSSSYFFLSNLLILSLRFLLIALCSSFSFILCDSNPVHYIKGPFSDYLSFISLGSWCSYQPNQSKFSLDIFLSTITCQFILNRWANSLIGKECYKSNSSFSCNCLEKFFVFFFYPVFLEYGVIFHSCIPYFI